ncbi:hypothetical protein G6F62_011505 [Rhizopus arrhizus]|nr:hypothetical protein G6F62_011505 [Rhizopus arrhizus]
MRGECRTIASRHERNVDAVGHEICYNVTPNQPVLVTHQRILGDPLTYRKYLDVVPVEEAGQKRKRLEFQTEAQVVQFVNNIYCIKDQGNIKEFSSLFENKTLLSFAPWCSTNKASFLKAKEDKNSSNRKRELYVTKDVYHDSLLTSICEYLPNYQQTLKSLQNEEIEIIGYARKSPSPEDQETRVRLLNFMTNNLRSRSLATRVYVSACSRSSTPLEERDLKNHEIYDELSNIDGDTQEMLKYLQSVKHDVCLVSLDFAGLSSRSHQTQTSARIDVVINLNIT